MPRHPLFGKIAGIDAFHAASDDVLARLDDGTLVVVHPRGAVGQSPTRTARRSWSWARIPMPHGVCVSTKDGRGDARRWMRVAAGEIEAAELLLRLLTA
jgi:hypothetical protein